MNPISRSRPPSPPHSTDGDFGRGDNKRNITQKTPYTPPRLVKTAPTFDASFDQYGDPSIYQTAPAHIYYTQQPTFTRDMQYHTPPAANADLGNQTRRRRVLGSPISPGNVGSSRRSRSPRNKRTPRNKAGKRGSPIVDQPLSISTKDYKLPIRDMGAWVNRPVAERLKEVEKKKGYIFCKENNHQVVSQVTGASWPLEPKEIRDMYEQYAIIERDNHQAAHPNYKFAPNKNGKKRNPAEDDEDDASDDDPDWEGSTRSAKRSRSSRQAESRSRTGTPFHHDVMHQYTTPQYQPTQLHPSSYQFNNPNGPIPPMFGANGFTHYYPTSVVPYGQHVDDVKFGKLDDTFEQFDMNMSLVGMPDTQTLNLMASQPTNTGLEDSEQVNVLDPRLGHYDSSYQYVHHEGVNQQYEIPRNFEYPDFSRQQQMVYTQNAYHPGMATLTDPQNPWIETGQAGADFDREFGNWS